MDLGVNLENHFKKYQELLDGVDRIFQKMKEDYAHEVRCDNGCTDCCFALFDLSLVEALYLNSKFSELDKDTQNMIMVEADKADRKVHKIKKRLFKDHKEGVSEQEILQKASQEKVRCPLLVNDRCVLYEHRPITCRLYGIPLDMGNFTAGCSLSGFETGEKYPTVYMHKIHERLAALSSDLATAINSKYPEMHTMLVPVSMCLLTDYTPEYLGIKKEPDDQQVKGSPGSKPNTEWVLGPKE